MKYIVASKMKIMTITFLSEKNIYYGVKSQTQNCIYIMIICMLKQVMYIHGNWKRARTMNTDKLLEWQNRNFLF